MNSYLTTERKTELSLLLVAFIWAANYPVIKFGILGLDAFVFNAIRFVTAGALLSLLFITKMQWQKVEPKDWLKLIGIGLIANVFYQVAFISGVKITNAGNAAVLLSTAPLWTILFQWLFQKKRIEFKTIVGMLISLTGIILIILGSGKKLEIGSYAMLGDLICLAAALFWALHTNLQKPMLTKYPTIQLALIMTLVGSIGLSLIALPSALTMDWASVKLSFYFAAVASGIFAIATANVLWSRSIKKIGPSRTANYNNLVPVLAFIISYFTLNEDVLPIQFVGAGVTIIGIVFAKR
ncbi:MAG: DMT family transporter [Bacteroidota bacterium]|nr:DMT family transporter [Bacteroidota bacterium]